MTSSDDKQTDGYAQLIEAGTIRLQRLLPGPIELVWAFLTESEKRGQWLASGEIDPKEGGEVNLFFQHANLSEEKEFPEKYKQYQNGHPMNGSVTRCEPPRVLSFNWNERPGVYTEVTFELTPKDEDVLMVLTHRRLTAREEQISTSAGWHAHLDILGDILSGRPRRGFWTNQTRLEEEYGKRIDAE